MKQFHKPEIEQDIKEEIISELINVQDYWQLNQIHKFIVNIQKGR